LTAKPIREFDLLGSSESREDLCESSDGLLVSSAVLDFGRNEDGGPCWCCWCFAGLGIGEGEERRVAALIVSFSLESLELLALVLMVGLGGIAAIGLGTVMGILVDWHRIGKSDVSGLERKGFLKNESERRLGREG
jgi:hypothetical protein